MYGEIQEYTKIVYFSPKEHIPSKFHILKIHIFLVQHDGVGLPTTGASAASASRSKPEDRPGILCVSPQIYPTWVDLESSVCDAEFFSDVFTIFLHN